MGPKTKQSFEIVKQYICEEYPEFGSVILHHCEDVEKDHKKKWRWHAHACHLPDCVCVCDAFEKLSDEQRAGIFVHEFGHIFCDKYPKLYPKNNDDNADKAAEQEFGIIIYYDDDDIEVVDLPLGDFLEEDEYEEPETKEKLDRGFFDPKPVTKDEYKDYFEDEGEVVDAEFDDSRDIGM